MNKLAEYRKTIAAFLVGLAAFLGVVLPLLTDGLVTNQDVIAVILAFAGWLGGTAAVYQVPNATPIERVVDDVKSMGKRA